MKEKFLLLVQAKPFATVLCRWETSSARGIQQKWAEGSTDGEDVQVNVTCCHVSRAPLPADACAAVIPWTSRLFLRFHHESSHFQQQSGSSPAATFHWLSWTQQVTEVVPLATSPPPAQTPNFWREQRTSAIKPQTQAGGDGADCQEARVCRRAPPATCLSISSSKINKPTPERTQLPFFVVVRPWRTENKRLSDEALVDLLVCRC